MYCLKIKRLIQNVPLEWQFPKNVKNYYCLRQCPHNFFKFMCTFTNFSVYSCVSTRLEIFSLFETPFWGIFTRNLMWTEAIIPCKLICLRSHVLMDLRPRYLPQQGTWMHLPAPSIKCFITHSGCETRE